LLIGQPLLKSK